MITIHVMAGKLHHIALGLEKVGVGVHPSFHEELVLTEDHVQSALIGARHGKHHSLLFLIHFFIEGHGATREHRPPTPIRVTAS